MKHQEKFQEIMRDVSTNWGIVNFPPAREIGPQEAAAIATLANPRGCRPDAPYREMSMILNLVYTLMKEWGWEIGK